MTTCSPIKPFRCWQYRKGEPVPEWVRHAITYNLGEDSWLVEARSPFAYWYTTAEFAERFKVIE